MGYKPMACGDRADARAMRDATDPKVSLELINPLYLRAATAPYVAAQLQNTEISLEPLVQGYRALSAEGYSPVLVEGAGGWEVPIAPGLSMSDFAVALGLPVVLVVGNRLGAVNHTVLTVQAIRSRGEQVGKLELRDTTGRPPETLRTLLHLAEEGRTTLPPPPEDRRSWVGERSFESDDDPASGWLRVVFSPAEEKTQP